MHEGCASFILAHFSKKEAMGRVETRLEKAGALHIGSAGNGAYTQA